MTRQFDFRRDAQGNPLWHAPLPNPEFDPSRPYRPDNSPFSVCQLCGEVWPCVEARYDAGPVAITGLWLRSKGSDRLQVLVEMDGGWRIVIEESTNNENISHIVEPLGIRHSRQVASAPVGPDGEAA